MSCWFSSQFVLEYPGFLFRFSSCSVKTMSEKMNRELISKLVSNREELDKFNEARITRRSAVEAPSRQRIEQLYSKRQAIIDKVDGFWSDKFSATGSPFVLNRAIDTKLLRAVTAFTITTPAAGQRCVTLRFRDTVFSAQGEVQATYEKSSMELISCNSTLHFKGETSDFAKGSILGFFEKTGMESDQRALLLGSFELLYRDPDSFVAAVA